MSRTAKTFFASEPKFVFVPFQGLVIGGSQLFCLLKKNISLLRNSKEDEVIIKAIGSEDHPDLLGILNMIIMFHMK